MKNLGDSAVASFASSSGSQRNTRIVRTIATPSVVSATAQADVNFVNGIISILNDYLTEETHKGTESIKY